MSCSMLSVFVWMFFITLTAGMSVEPRCRCSGLESRRVGKLINHVELFPPNSHCTHTEIIATLKGSGQEICLDPKAPWVVKVIEKIMANRVP